MAAGNFFGGQFFGGGFFGELASEAPPRTGGGYLRHDPSNFRKSREQVRRERIALGIPESALDVIEGVAKRQAAGVESAAADEQKRLEELERELQLAGIAWQSRYLEALNDLREQYITEEISRLMAQKLENEETMVLMAMAATA